MTKKSSANKRPPATSGLRHVALFVDNLAACEYFYVTLLGMRVEWRPDADNVYLTSGNDNLALHRRQKKPDDHHKRALQTLAHIGFIIDHPEQVDDWYVFLKSRDVVMVEPPRTHRDGARSFYCYDPVHTLVQLIYHPPIARQSS